MMKRCLGSASLVLLTASCSLGGTVFSENFENPAGLFDGNWGNLGSAVIVANPSVDANNPSANVVMFTSDGSGGDLFSSFFPEGTWLTFSFDFFQTAATPITYAYAGTDHQNLGPCGNSFCDEEWLWNQSGGAIFGTTPPPNTWVHVSFSFPPLDDNNPFDAGNAGQIVVKFEGSGGQVFFDNIQLNAVPEPAAGVTMGAGLLAAIACFRRRPLRRPR